MELNLTFPSTCSCTLATTEDPIRPLEREAHLLHPLRAAIEAWAVTLQEEVQFVAWSVFAPPQTKNNPHGSFLPIKIEFTRNAPIKCNLDFNFFTAAPVHFWIFLHVSVLFAPHSTQHPNPPIQTLHFSKLHCSWCSQYLIPFLSISLYFKIPDCII